MIYVRIELWPKGDKTRAKLLGEATIKNDGAQHKRTAGQRGSYWADFWTGAGREKGSRSFRIAYVNDFPRKSLLVWDLLMRALVIALDDRQKNFFNGRGAKV